MPFSVEILATGFTIASGGTTSNVLTTDTVGIDSLRDADGLCVYAPSSLTGIVSVEVSPDNLSWATLTSGNTDVTVGAAKAVTLTEITWRYMRLKSASSEGAQRSFIVSKLVR